MNETTFEYHSDWEVLLAFSGLASSTHEKHWIREYVRLKEISKVGIRLMENLKTNGICSSSLASS